jgi:hypothetical protein
MAKETLLREQPEQVLQRNDAYRLILNNEYLNYKQVGE